MSALCSILNSAYYANNYAGIFDAGLVYSGKFSRENNSGLSLSKTLHKSNFKDHYNHMI